MRQARRHKHSTLAFDQPPVYDHDFLRSNSDAGPQAGTAGSIRVAATRAALLTLLHSQRFELPIRNTSRARLQHVLFGSSKPGRDCPAGFLKATSNLESPK